jgi:hypothetical protein
MKSSKSKPVRFLHVCDSIKPDGFFHLAKATVSRFTLLFVMRRWNVAKLQHSNVREQE